MTAYPVRVEARFDEPLNRGLWIVKRFLGDVAIERGWTVPVTAEPSGKRVLVVGAGLSAAYHLTLLGHAVTVLDAGPAPGGMMRFGIPRYRLPRHVLDSEIQRILDMGVTLEPGRAVTDMADAMSGFGAAFLAVGAHIGKRAYIPAGDSARILDAVSVLRGVEAPPRRCWAAASSSTAAATPPWTPPGPPGGWARATRSSSTAARATACPRMTARSPRRPRKACG